MTVILRQSNNIKDVDETAFWYAVTGTNVDLDPGRQLANLGARLEKEFEEVREYWWQIAKDLGQTKSGRLAHMPTAASYNSDFGLMMAWVRLTKSVSTEPLVCLVVCDDPWLFRELAKIKSVEAGRIPTLWPHIIRKWIRGYLARSLLGISVAVRSILLRHTQENIGKQDNVLLVYGHPSSSANGYDAYFGSLMKELPALKRLIHTDADLKNARRLSSSRTVSLHAWGSLWYAPMIIFKLWRPRLSDATREFSWLLRRSIAYENSTAALATNSWQMHCQSRFLDYNKPKIIVWPWENHPWERELCRTAKKLGIKTIGYQHAVIGPHQYNTSPASNPDGLESIPDRIICSGPAYYRQLIRWGMPTDRLIIGGAFRISRFEGNYYDQDGPVFVATSSDTEITKLMMQAVAKVEKKGKKFLIKIHPLYPKKIEENENVKITPYTIPEQSGISAVFYGTGMSGLEGLLAGVPTFRLRPEDRIAVNVLPEGVEAIPVSKEELGVALDKALKPLPLDWEKIYAPISINVWKNELETPKGT